MTRLMLSIFVHFFHNYTVVVFLLNNVTKNEHPLFFKGCIHKKYYENVNNSCLTFVNKK
jgi:hypothetical protein